jgi:hypothetical protein
MAHTQWAMCHRYLYNLALPAGKPFPLETQAFIEAGQHASKHLHPWQQVYTHGSRFTRISLQTLTCRLFSLFSRFSSVGTKAYLTAPADWLETAFPEEYEKYCKFDPKEFTEEMHKRGMPEHQTCQQAYQEWFDYQMDTYLVGYIDVNCR